VEANSPLDERQKSRRIGNCSPYKNRKEKMSKEERELRERLAKTIEGRPDSQRVKDRFLNFVEHAPVSMLCDFDEWCIR
jgi:hypothetical protein